MQPEGQETAGTSKACEAPEEREHARALRGTYMKSGARMLHRVLGLAGGSRSQVAEIWAILPGTASWSLWDGFYPGALKKKVTGLNQHARKNIVPGCRVDCRGWTHMKP